ncbi:MAG: sigma-70 family RNA polymerase sigma factor [Cytophagales bacterium]|nr:sigma-70 family RNA polymerase sigma factor [Armatimonadota bacterium]
MMLRARSGDVVAQDRLRETLRPRLESLAGYYASRTGMDSADLLQEAWVAVFEALPTIDVTVGTPSQYLLKHARWQILDHIRWNKRRSHEMLEDSFTETMEAADNNFAISSTALPGTSDVEAKMIVEDLERRLSHRQKAILQGLLDGHTWRQIGDSLGCTSANVAYHVRGIRQAYVDLVHTGMEAAYATLD